MGGLFNDLHESIGKEIDIVTTHTLEQESTKARTPLFVESIQKEMLKLFPN